MVERAAHNGFVVGSNPARPILKLLTFRHKRMDFNLKNYQIFKLKKYLKKNDFFFLFHSAKLSLNKWTSIEQNLKKLKLEYYKPLNRTTSKIFKSSIFENFSSIIGGFVLFVNSSNKNNELNLKHITKTLKPNFVLISVKLNNKIYSPAQLKGMKDLSYKKNVFNLHRSLNRYLKTSHVLTSKSKNSK